MVQQPEDDDAVERALRDRTLEPEGQDQLDNFGDLAVPAIPTHRATGDRKLLDVVVRFGNLIVASSAPRTTCRTPRGPTTPTTRWPWSNCTG